MAYWVKEIGTNYRNNVKSFYADFETDIADLPTNTTLGKQYDDDKDSCELAGYGSDVLVLETGNVYVLGKETNIWKKI